MENHNVKELLTYIVRSLVQDPDAISVNVVEAGDTLTVNVGKDGLTVEKKQTEAENK